MNRSTPFRRVDPARACARLMPHKRYWTALAFRKERGRCRRAGAEEPERPLPGSAAPKWKPRREAAASGAADNYWDADDDQVRVSPSREDDAESSQGPECVLTPGPNASHGASRRRVEPREGPAAAKEEVDRPVSGSASQGGPPLEGSASSSAAEALEARIQNFLEDAKVLSPIRPTSAKSAKVAE